MGVLQVVTILLRQLLQSRAALAAENLALRQQVAVLQRSVKLPRLHPRDRIFWVWRVFLTNHAREIAAIDFFAVPTVNFRILICFLVLRHHRRTVVHFNVTSHPTARWTAQQIVEAFPYDTAPRYLLRDRDRIYGSCFANRIRGMGIEEVLIAARSPWQNPFVERLIGSIRRECLDHVLVLGEAHLRRILREYFAYYHDSRPHQSLDCNAPRPREIEPPSRGRIVAEPQVGGLHHRYRRAA